MGARDSRLLARRRCLLVVILLNNHQLLNSHWLLNSPWLLSGRGFLGRHWLLSRCGFLRRCGFLSQPGLVSCGGLLLGDRVCCYCGLLDNLVFSGRLRDPLLSLNWRLLGDVRRLGCLLLGAVGVLLVCHQTSISSGCGFWAMCGCS